MIETPAPLFAALPAPDKNQRSGFDPCPASWFYVGSKRELKRGPMKFELPGGRHFVVYLTREGHPVVLSARCAHMGADLAKGCVRGDRIVCPLHNWEFGSDGQCERIPVASAAEIPPFARQLSFSVEERGGQIFFFNEVRTRFPLPFFEGVDPEELRPSPAFDLHDEVSWEYIAANGFDLQHFRAAHDRVLLGIPVVDSPHAYCRRITLKFKVAGTSVSDRLTRWFAGPEVTMTLSAWCGTLIFVRAQFRRTTSYGLMTVRPLEHKRTHARVVVWVRRSRSRLGRLSIDPINGWLRRRFVRTFLSADLGRLAGIRYDANRLIGADNFFADYMDWLRQVHR